MSQDKLKDDKLKKLKKSQSLKHTCVLDYEK